jgi:hypothetical protein
MPKFFRQDGCHTPGSVLRGCVPCHQPVPLQLQAHSQNDISDIYRFPLVTKGIFVNPALQEPFGLTVIEVRTDRCQREAVLWTGCCTQCAVACRM